MQAYTKTIKPILGEDGVTIDLSEKLKSLPLTPGVYLMKDGLGHIIYVGKAKQLKRRVKSYFQNSKSHSPKVKQLVRHIKDLDIILTDTEFEAFMLECKLIKEIKPMYNRKMKNPQAYTYIVIGANDKMRSLEITYDPPANQKGNQIWGPYTSRSTVERAVQGIKESSRILCSNPSFKNSLCLNHSLGLCIGMCAGGDAAIQYNAIIDRVIGLLNGTDASILEEMDQRMAVAAEQYDFETAAKYRDYIGAISFLIHKEKVIEFAEENQNIAILEAMNEQTLKLILLKGNRILSHTKLEYDQPDITHLQAVITSAIVDTFHGELDQVSAAISRHEIDEAQIIYSYLKSSSCSYIIVQEDWLSADNPSRLDIAVDELLRIFLNAAPAQSFN
ncbi:GIY-YIG nuclease family protein [Paenibacillus sp. FSL R10-2734]|uniref:GIY-YIG nuclease family protein n=1 Tax=Paenibacillus sp. FSL R10-2734 TaxID=2954691 RepID=UPI0030D6F66E